MKELHTVIAGAKQIAQMLLKQALLHKDKLDFKGENVYTMGMVPMVFTLKMGRGYVEIRMRYKATQKSTEKKIRNRIDRIIKAWTDRNNFGFGGHNARRGEPDIHTVYTTNGITIQVFDDLDQSEVAATYRHKGLLDADDALYKIADMVQNGITERVENCYSAVAKTIQGRNYGQRKQDKVIILGVSRKSMNMASHVILVDAHTKVITDTFPGSSLSLANAVYTTRDGTIHEVLKVISVEEMLRKYGPVQLPPIPTFRQPMVQPGRPGWGGDTQTT